VAGKPAAGGSASEAGARDGQTDSLTADDAMLSQAVSQYYADKQQGSVAAKVNLPTD